MEIKVNGTIRIEEKANFDSPADNRNTQEIPAPIDHNKDQYDTYFLNYVQRWNRRDSGCYVKNGCKRKRCG